MTSTTVAERRVFLGGSTLLFTASAAVTIAWCASMSAMGGMSMPGGWTMSMAWVRMPGQTWPGAAASFLCMWVVMMVAMMLPSLAPALGRYLQAVRSPGEARLGVHCSLCCLGLMAILLATGVMDLRVMTVVAAAITVERLAPAGERVARATGAVVIAVGLLLIARGTVLG
jgi:predicted metal-binding membrane protein